MNGAERSNFLCTLFKPLMKGYKVILNEICICSYNSRRPLRQLRPHEVSCGMMINPDGHYALRITQRIPLLHFLHDVPTAEKDE